MNTNVLIAALVCSMLAEAALAHDYSNDIVICATQSGIDEMAKAMEQGDGQWANSISGCFLAKKPARIERIECSWDTCKVRAWAVSGSSQSTVVYTLRQFAK